MAARRRSAKKRSSGPGAPAVLGVLTVLVLLVGGWILAGGYANGLVRSWSNHVSQVGVFTRTPPTVVSPQPTTVVVDDTRVKELEAELKQTKTALSKKDEEIANLRAEIDNLKASRALLKAELDMRQ